MVVAQEARAARVGVEVLQNGGNAVDAAVATGFALAVTYPRAGNIGGGGYMVIHLAGAPWAAAIDYRETAPAATTRDVFLDSRGDADPAKSRESALAIGVPGTVAGLALAHAKYGSGKFTLAELIAPAIELAREGIPVADDVADSLPRAQPRLARWPSSAKIFLKADGSVLAPGDLLIQRDLADTLAAIAREGPRAFYQGPIAEHIAAAVQSAGGRMTRADLAAYAPIEYAPVRGSYRGHEIISMPPSSSGGVILIEMLNILEGYQDLAADNAKRAHLMIEAMKLAYADRALFLGDPASVNMPLANLMSKAYAARLRGRIDPERARPAAEIRPGSALREGDNTTHYSVVDQLRQRGGQHLYAQLQLWGRPRRRGHRHSAQQRARRFRRQAGGAQRLWADRRRRQRARTRQAAAVVDVADHRAQGRQAVPGHRLAGRQPHHHHGAAGDLNVIDRGMTIAEAVAEPRLHAQWTPDEVFVERGFPADLVRALAARGHKLVERPPGTAANSILVTPQGLVGAADGRTRGALAAGY